MPCLLIRRDRFEDHVTLVIATDAHVGMIHRHYSACASNCLELWDQHPNGLQGFFAKATLGCELVRGDHASVNFIKQELTQRLQMIKCFIDDGQRTGEHGRTPKCVRLYLYTADCAEGQICGSTQTPRQVHQGGECVTTLPISAQTRSRLGWPQLIEGATQSRR